MCCGVSRRAWDSAKKRPVPKQQDFYDGMRLAQAFEKKLCHLSYFAAVNNQDNQGLITNDRGWIPTFNAMRNRARHPSG